MKKGPKLSKRNGKSCLRMRKKSWKKLLIKKMSNMRKIWRSGGKSLMLANKIRKERSLKRRKIWKMNKQNLTNSKVTRRRKASKKTVSLTNPRIRIKIRRNKKRRTKKQGSRKTVASRDKWPKKKIKTKEANLKKRNDVSLSFENN